MKKGIKFAIFLATGFAIFYFLLQNIGLEGLKTAFGSFDWRFALLAFGFYVVLNIFRALRFNFFLGGKVGFSGFLRIIFIYNFWNQILPFRSGELSYFYFVKKSEKVSLPESVASLVLARIFDLFVIGLFASAGFYFVFSGIEAGISFKNWSLFAVFLMAALFVILVFFHRRLLSFLDYVLQKTRLSGFKIVCRVFKKFSEAAASFSSIKESRVFFAFLAYTALIWFFDFFMIWAMAAASGIIIGFWQAVIAASILMFALFILPLQTPGNLGTYEGALAAVFLVFGLEKSIAVGAGILIHIQNIIFALLLFVFAYAFKQWFIPQNSNTL